MHFLAFLRMILHVRERSCISGKGLASMCELFGLSADRKVNINKELKEFYSHAPDHPNGWGLYYDDGGSVFFEKEDKRADRSQRLKSILSRRIHAQKAIGHIRYATVGYDEIENTHPFRGKDLSGREWVFAHNGTIFDSDLLSSYFHKQKGETDSERIFLYMLDEMNALIRQKARPLSERERFSVLEKMVARLSPHNKLNLLINDGHILYLHANYTDSLYIREQRGVAYISTKPLSDGLWKHVPFTRLVSYKDGRQAMVACSHGKEYIPDPESIKALFLMYSHL